MKVSYLSLDVDYSPLAMWLEGKAGKGEETVEEKSPTTGALLPASFSILVSSAHLKLGNC